LRLPARLLIITDRKGAVWPLEDVVGAALRGGCRWLSLRENDLEHDERVTLLSRIVALGRSRGATITVHGDIEAAAATGADGVHLPAGGSAEQARTRLGKGALIGLSVHSAREAAAAHAAVD
jgi:thiamine-phosphate pyrophosphorylase